MFEKISGFLWSVGWSIRFFLFEKFQCLLNWRRAKNSLKENVRVNHDPAYDEEGYLFERNFLIFLVLTTLAMLVSLTALAAVFYRLIFGWGWAWAIGLGAITVFVSLIIYDWYFERRTQAMNKLAPSSSASHDEVFLP